MTDSQLTERSVVVGIDFGTLSGRAVVVRVSDGQQLGSAVHAYSHGVIESSLPTSGSSTGQRLPKDWALQVPSDYIDVLRHAVPDALRDSGVDAAPEWCAIAARDAGQSLHEWLSDQPAEQRVGAHGLVALDWHSGNRSVLVDHGLTGLVVGLTLRTQPADIYRALLEATAFGTRVIVEAFEAHGVPVGEPVVAGGLIKNRLLMQIYSDVTRRPLSVAGSDQGPALGTAIHAAVAAGAYPDVHAASAAMGAKTERAFVPDSDRADAYDALFAEYVRLHDYFGCGANDVMHRLGDTKRAATAL